MELKELYDKYMENWGQMKVHMDQQDAEVKKWGEKDAEKEKTIQTFSDKIGELEAEIKKLRAAPFRPQVAGTDGGWMSSKERLDEKKRADYELYFKALRFGFVNLDNDERKEVNKLYSTKQLMQDDPDERKLNARYSPESKALSLGDETAGGYLAPPEFVQDIIKGVQLISPIRPLAQIRPTSRRAVQYPVRSGVFAAKWTAETGNRNETPGLTYALEEIPNHEMFADVLVSDQDLEDAVFNLEQEILDNCSEQFAKAEGMAFVNGTGVGQPEGILTNANVAYSPNPGSATVLDQTGLIQIWGDLKTVYAKNATWLMNRQSIAAARSLKDLQGRYLWEPGLADGTPPNLLGSPYIEVPDMPNIAANAYPVVYGNVKRAYLIVDRINVVVRRLQEKYAESGQIAYLVRKRVGGQVVLPEAIRKLKIATS